MSEHILRTIEDLQNKVREQEASVAETKRMVNGLCKMAGVELIYASVDVQEESFGSIRSDQFYGQPLASALREIFTLRRAAKRGATSVNELYGSLVQGGFKFDAKDDENAKRGLRISLTKNPAFHRLPNGHYGLSEWYPAIKEAKVKHASAPIEEQELGPPEIDDDPTPMVDDSPAFIDMNAESKPHPRKQK